MSDEVKPTEAVAAAAPPAITAEGIATAVATAMQAHQASIESAPKEMTPEEKAAYLQVFDPNADGFLDSFVSAITDAEATPEIRAKAIEHLRDGLVNQSVRGSQLLIDQRLNEFRREFAPVFEDSTKRQAEALWDQFPTFRVKPRAYPHPHLGPHYIPLIHNLSNQPKWQIIRHLGMVTHIKLQQINMRHQLRIKHRRLQHRSLCHPTSEQADDICSTVNLCGHEI